LVYFADNLCMNSGSGSQVDLKIQRAVAVFFQTGLYQP
jgi:hypothetical protein